MPIKTYKQIPQTVQTIVWDGTNTDEVLALIGDAFVSEGIHGIEFKLKEPNHYGNYTLMLTKGGTFTRFSNGAVTNYDRYAFDSEEWELIETK